METKVCSKCGRELPLNEFYKNKGMKDGHKNECKECFKQRQKQYYKGNRDTILEQTKQYRQEHKEHYAEYFKEHKEEKAEYDKQYNSTPMGRALNLIGSYKYEDKKHNRGECTLTAKWIIDNIFTQPCHWCNKTDWRKIGCDRIDNDKPHTPDNVNPCCEECNKKRGRKTYEEFLLII